MPRKLKMGRSGKASLHGRRTGALHMSWLPWAALAAVLIVAGVFTLLRLRADSPVVVEITPGQAYEKYQAGAFILDVRSEAEFAEGYIARSVLIPLDELANRLDEVPRDRDVVVICRSGTRSREGAAILHEAGFPRVACLSEGLLAWNQAGYPLESGQ